MLELGNADGLANLGQGLFRTTSTETCRLAAFYLGVMCHRNPEFGAPDEVAAQAAQDMADGYMGKE